MQADTNLDLATKNNLCWQYFWTHADGMVCFSKLSPFFIDFDSDSFIDTR